MCLYCMKALLSLYQGFFMHMKGVYFFFLFLFFFFSAQELVDTIHAKQFELCLRQTSSMQISLNPEEEPFDL